MKKDEIEKVLGKKRADLRKKFPTVAHLFCECELQGKELIFLDDGEEDSK